MQDNSTKMLEKIWTYWKLLSDSCKNENSNPVWVRFLFQIPLRILPRTPQTLQTHAWVHSGSVITSGRRSSKRPLLTWVALWGSSLI